MSGWSVSRILRHNILSFFLKSKIFANIFEVFPSYTKKSPTLSTRTNQTGFNIELLNSVAWIPLNITPRNVEKSQLRFLPVLLLVADEEKESHPWGLCVIYTLITKHQHFPSDSPTQAWQKNKHFQSKTSPKKYKRVMVTLTLFQTISDTVIFFPEEQFFQSSCSCFPSTEAGLQKLWPLTLNPQEHNQRTAWIRVFVCYFIWNR